MILNKTETLYVRSRCAYLSQDTDCRSLGSRLVVANRQLGDYQQVKQDLIKFY